MNRRTRFLLAALLPLGLGALQPATTRAASNQVAACTQDALQAAITAAASNGLPVTFEGLGACTIPVSGPATMNYYSSTAFIITGAVQIDGSGAQITLDGQRNYRIFEVAPGGSLSVNALTLANGDHDEGGAIDNHGTATVTNSTFTGDSALSGAAIFNGTGESLTVANSTFYNNGAAQGGAMTLNGPASVLNSTFSGNQGIAEPTAQQHQGGAIFVQSGATLTLDNTIVAGNTVADGGGPDISSVGTITGTNNLIGDGSDSGLTDGANNNMVGNTGNRTGTIDPLLGPLQDNGGPTQTMAPLPGSPTIGVGDASICAAPPVNGLDQRGRQRPVGSCDIGAYDTRAGIPGTWAATGSLVAARFNTTATLLKSGKVLMAGGFGSGVETLSSAELYDPIAGTWTATGSMAVARANATATLLPSGKVLVAGGIQFNGTVLGSAELYDPATGAWTMTGSLVTARYDATATLLPSGKVLLAGGVVDHGSPYNSAELYDPATGIWSATGSLAASRIFATATLLDNGMVLVAGGEGGATASALSSAELYDPATGAWAATGSMATGRYEATATLLPSGMVLVTGGEDTGGALSSAELYDPAIGTWTTTGSLATARYFATATLLTSGDVLVAGGWRASGSPLSSAELYDPAIGTWAATGSLTVARAQAAQALLTGGEVLVAGGGGGGVGSALSSAELYTAAGAAPTATATSSATAIPTATATSTATTTNTPTVTSSATDTPTSTITPAPTLTATATGTPQSGSASEQLILPLTNAGTSSDGTASQANFDNDGYSYSAQALLAAGIAPGGSFTTGGVPFNWPAAGPGSPDNTVAQGQTIALATPMAGSSLAFLGSASNGPAGGSGTLTYTDSSTQSFTLTFSDWTLNGGSATGPTGGNTIAAALPYRDTLSGGRDAVSTYLFTASIALQPGKALRSVTLPTPGSGLLHIFAATVVATSSSATSTFTATATDSATATASPTTAASTTPTRTATATSTWTATATPTSTPALLSPAYVQGASAVPRSPQTSVAVRIPNAQAAGDLNVVAVGWNDTTATVASVTDSAGNSYQPAVPMGQTTGLRQAVYYAKNIAASPGTTVTVRFSQAAAYPDIRVLEYANLDRTSPLDAGATAAGASSTADSGAATTAGAPELLVGAGMTLGHFSGAGAGYTARMITSPDGDIVEDRLATAAGSYHATAPVTKAWLMQLATFRAAS